MPILQSLSFLYDNINSQDLGVINCQVGSNGLYEEFFLPERELKEITTRYNDKPSFIQIKTLPRSFTLTLAFNEEFNEDNLREIKRLFSSSSYKSMIFESLPDYVYYCILVDSTPLSHNGIHGYAIFNFRCSDPYVYSSVYLDDEIDLSTNPIYGTSIIFTNKGDLPCQPQISLLKVNDGDISIINNSDGGKEFKLSTILDSDGNTLFESLKDGEDLFIDNEQEEITSSLPNTYRINNLTGDFLSLNRGVNNLVIKGTCKIQFRYQFKLY